MDSTCGEYRLIWRFEHQTRGRKIVMCAASSKGETFWGGMTLVCVFFCVPHHESSASLHHCPVIKLCCLVSGGNATEVRLWRHRVAFLQRAYQNVHISPAQGEWNSENRKQTVEDYDWNCGGSFEKRIRRHLLTQVQVRNRIHPQGHAGQSRHQGNLLF